MKQFILLVLIAVLQLTSVLTPATAEASDKKVCKVATNDIGTIVGRGSNYDTAFEDASTQCFDRREQLYRMKKGGSLDEETGLVIIDSCANIRCG